jgi:hypothetical protein
MSRRISDMSDNAIVRIYRSNKMHISTASTAKCGTILSVPHNGRRIAMQAKPIAPVADYDEWLWNRNRRTNSNNRCTGAKLRRIVIMRRQGSTWQECGEAVGVKAWSAKAWVEFLPFDLSV